MRARRPSGPCGTRDGHTFGGSSKSSMSTCLSTNGSAGRWIGELDKKFTVYCPFESCRSFECSCYFKSYRYCCEWHSYHKK